MSARLVRTGLLAALAAAVATTVVAALERGLGVSFEVPDGGEAIPLSGIAFVTAVLSVERGSRASRTEVVADGNPDRIEIEHVFYNTCLAGIVGATSLADEGASTRGGPQ